MINQKFLKRGLCFTLATSLGISGVCLDGNSVEAASKKPKKIVVSNKQLSKNTLKINKGSSLQLKVKVSPSKASQKVTFTSSNKKIVSVSSKGKLKGVKVGSAKITIKSKSNKKVKKVIKVKVVKKSTAVPSSTPVVAQTEKPVTPEGTPGLVPTSVPTEGLLTKINGKSVIMNGCSFNTTDFTISIKAALEDGTQLNSLLPADVNASLTGSQIQAVCGNTSIIASYSGYSYDSNMLIYKVTDTGVATLQPSKNGKEIGSADGTYVVSSKYLGGTQQFSYYENLVGNSISGFVYSEDTGKPVQGAVVKAYTSDSVKEVTTNDKGYYKLPLGSALYKVRVENKSSDAYFSQETTGKVSNNSSTACNFELSKYDENQLFISGRVKSSRSNQDLANATVELFEVSATGEKSLGKVKTGASGAFVFGNYSCKGTKEYKAFETSANGTVALKRFKKGQGLKNQATYKIVISKDVTGSLLDAHKEKVINNIKFDYTKQYELSQVVLEGVATIKSMNVQVKWNDNMPTVKSNKANVTVKVAYRGKNTEKICDILAEKKVSIPVSKDSKMSDNINIVDLGVFESYPTLPTGRYYIGIDDGVGTNTLIWQPVDIVEGNNVEVNTISINGSRSVTVRTIADVLNENSLVGSEPGGHLKVVVDENGKTDAAFGDVKNQLTLYQEIEGDLLLVEKNSNAPYKYSVNPISVVSDATFSRAGAGLNYAVKTLNCMTTTENQYLRFTQGNSVISNHEFKVKGAADMYAVKIARADLFKKQGGSLGEKDKVYLEYVRLVNSAGQVVGNWDLTGEFEGGKAMTVADAVKGIIIPGEVDGVSTGMQGIAPSDVRGNTGGYKLVTKFKGYNEAVADFKCIDFQAVTVTYKKDIELTQETGIVGSISVGGVDAQDNKEDTIDASVILLDSSNKIVGVGTYGNNYNDGKAIRQFSIVNGTNGVLDGGTYTIVVRCGTSGLKTSFDTFSGLVDIQKGKLTSLNIEVQPGNNGSAMFGITDSTSKALVNPVVCLLDKWSSLSTGVAVDDEVKAEVAALPEQLKGIVKIPVSSNPMEFVRNESISKGSYELWAKASGTELVKLTDVNLSSGQNFVKTGLQVGLTVGDGKIPVTVKYKRDESLTAIGAFDVVTVQNDNGEVLGFSLVDNEGYKAGEVEQTVVSIPNVPGTYRVVIYSNGSFLSKDSVTVQGVSKEITVNLVKASVN